MREALQNGVDKRFGVSRRQVFEDCFWQHLVIDRVVRYGIKNEPLYYYRQCADSISGVVSDKNRDLLEGYSIRLDFIRKKYP